MDLTILNVAIPDLLADLRPSMAQIQWNVDGYALVLGGTVLARGALTDRMGRRRTFLAGLVLCAGTSVFGAIAQTPLQTSAARGGMGAAGALMMPATLSIIHWMYPEPMLRRRAIAVWTAVAAAGGLTGPVIGGWLVEHFSWRAGFWVNVPLAAAAFLLTCLLVPESRAKRTEPLDGVGTAMSAAGLLVLVWAIIESPVHGRTSGPVLLAYAPAWPPWPSR
ncbi:MFS transporter [Streptomyces sp. NPDC051218]|uniref:MFS transporter n=1 Tax=Streptomyces sp. NPDC051218 TaxID=3365645 RepID=UPI0037ACC176